MFKVLTSAFILSSLRCNESYPFLETNISGLQNSPVVPRNRVNGNMWIYRMWITNIPENFNVLLKNLFFVSLEENPSFRISDRISKLSHSTFFSGPMFLRQYLVALEINSCLFHFLLFETVWWESAFLSHSTCILTTVK